ncbi:HNH endonuclease signature motif containing protein [Mycobacterium sp. Aquia_216]|uniref:HNH endonuclease signature motif containing protein n=1 Tax=Mycobacterium sp. Aquia_216 TaxID=2991729 RepID=UPI00227AFD89|nr:HNH endonuclease signature motif containing protein [Mycobacterium sp. Aquia_216]WAJ42733.1 HNH endonuclease signature motif containing protein [Mycobacterium sp. Aquia_216]
MGSSSREQVQADYDALRAVISRIQRHSYDSLTTPERLGLLEVLECETRRLQVPGHQLVNQLAQQATPDELGGKLSLALSDRLHISRAESARRVAEADDLGRRRALTGEQLEPRLPATAAAQRDGAIGASHVRVIRQFFDDLPAWVDVETQALAEQQLARRATEFRPEQVRKLADRLAYCINPDGNFSDVDRARRRGLLLGKQEIDGMSRLSGWLTAETRATIEAVLAKLAAPGMCNPDDLTPVIDGTPGEEAIQRDSRSAIQRNHDGLQAALRAVLASGELGQHNGLPATIIVTTTLQELEAAAGTALTGGGTLLPMSDVIRMARHAHHYLAIFDNGRPLALHHAKRLASPGQRIVLYAKDRGCSAPGCDLPGYLCEVHHIDDYAICRSTDMDNLTFACRPHHRLIKPGGWKTRNRANGDTEWIPPPHLDRGQPRVNTFHHPERLLGDDDEE